MKSIKKICFFLLVPLCLMACSSDDTSAPDMTEDPVADEPVADEPMDDEPMDEDPTAMSRSRDDVMALLNSAIANNKVITGQHCGDGFDQTESFYGNFVEDLAQETGKYVGLVGADIGFMVSETYPIQTLIDHWNEGGLVSVSWHLDNPFVEGYTFRENSVTNRDVIDFNALLRDAPDSDAKNNYRAELDQVAMTLTALKDAGVVVIWRPFHEMNSDWFWWGANDYSNQQTNEEDYIAFWQDLHGTLTDDYGLDNLIWAYATSPDFGWNGAVTAFYPGDDYVDLVGVDYYGDAPDYPDFEAISSLGKTVVMTETGPSSGNRGSWDELAILEALKGKAAYFLQWHSWEGADVSIIDNQNANAMMNSEDALTRDEL